jgi:fructose-1,6-bisphosphatase/inositol monophosphatase family enzyme
MRRVADQVIRPRFRALTASQIAEKGPGDYVTVADREAEELLTAALLEAFPGTAVIGEEAVAGSPELLDGIDQHDHAFVVDPIDGTRNFVGGNPDYAVMIGELRHGLTTRAWIWQPEHEVALVAQLGGGVLRNGVALAPIDRLRKPMGRASPSRFIRLDSPTLAEPIQQSWSSAGVDYPNLFAGLTDFLCFNPPKPWDHVPGTLMLRELGGVARTIDGQEYGPAVGGGYLIAAAQPAIWTTVHTVVSAAIAAA